MKWILLTLLTGTNIEVDGIYPNIDSEIIYTKDIKVSKIIGEKRFKYKEPNYYYISCEFEYHPNGWLKDPVKKYYGGSCESLIEKINEGTGCSN